MSKNNHLQVEALIKQAIQACSYDSALSETKSYLAAALNRVDTVSKKRSRKIANEKANAAARTKQQEWWDMLKKNASNNIDLGWIDDE